MESLSACLEFVRSTSLATCLDSCFQKPQDGRNEPEPAASGTCTCSTMDQSENSC